MAIAMGRALLLHPCSASSSSTLSFTSRNTHNPYSSLAADTLWSAAKTGPRHPLTVAQAQPRPTWLPGLDPPPYLDGSLPGDYGFDPLGLGEDPDSLKWYVQAELVHARFSMLGVAGILFTDLLRVTGIKNLPVWYEAGAVKFDFASTRTLLFVQLLWMGYAETRRYMDFVSPGSQAKEGSFFGLEAALEDVKSAGAWKQKEIKNGRLAMVAMLGFFVQAAVTHKGPIDNLVEHLSNPFHNTIIHTLSN
ncbi:unnamed protein product [Linum tenue]|uniref:Chlorophyll a-b binding protein, chloroplastic n=1 Tax=Linum tenue TaxID=586396 RepID=A0AAV0RKJ9_9ROSI|nr:unnamed protein product [Linum tenue]